jgi:hypothetical protein
MDTVSQRHRLTLRIRLSMAGTDRQYGMWIQEKPTFLFPLTVAVQIRTGSEKHPQNNTMTCADSIRPQTSEEDG